MSAQVEIAQAAWGEPLPDWIARLAAECALTSQNQVAKRIGRSAGLVSQVLRRTYRGDMAGVEEAVRGAYMAEVVACPALGTIPSNTCQAWRRKGRRFANANALTVQMFRACARCPRGGAAPRPEAVAGEDAS